MVIFCCAPKNVQAEVQPTLKKDPSSPVAMESPASGKKKGREETWKQLEARASRGGASES